MFNRKIKDCHIKNEHKCQAAFGRNINNENLLSHIIHKNWVSLVYFIQF